MYFTNYIALFGFPLLCLAVFAFVAPRRAAIACVMGGWMFLPIAGIPLPGLPDYTKISAISIGVMLAILVFDSPRLLTFRPRLIDLPMAVWCLVPFISSLDNYLGVYDGLSAIMDHTLNWGVPYFIGRLYVTDLAGLRDVALGLTLAGLVYAPMVLFEVRMSPKFHWFLYGIRPSEMLRRNTLGLPGFRPEMFMMHGLIVGAFMLTCTIAAVWLWMTGALKQIWGVPMWCWAGLLWLTTTLCQVAGIIGLLHVAIGIMFATRWMRSSVLIGCVVAAPLLYITLRTSNVWDARGIVRAIAEIDEDRASSLRTRLENEEALIAKAKWMPVWGWAKWGRFRVKDELGNDLSLTDGLWVIALGQHGLVGLTAFVAVFVLPGLLLVLKLPGRYWPLASVAPATGLALLLALCMIDNLFNATASVVTMMCAGALAGVLPVFANARAGRAPGGAGAGVLPAYNPMPGPASQAAYSRRHWYGQHQPDQPHQP